MACSTIVKLFYQGRYKKAVNTGLNYTSSITNGMIDLEMEKFFNDNSGRHNRRRRIHRRRRHNLHRRLRHLGRRHHNYPPASTLEPAAR